MKAKKWVTIITSICTLIAFTLALAQYYLTKNIIYDFSMAIFGSALLSAIMSLTEYFSERKRAMETFWWEARKVLGKFRKIKYIDIDEPIDLIIACITEEEYNKFSPQQVQKRSNNKKRELHFYSSSSAKQAYIDWLQNNYKINKSDIDNKLIYKQKIDYYREYFAKQLIAYIGYAEIDMDNITQAYGNLDFLFGNKKIRQVAFDDIYDKLLNCRHKLLLESAHFKLWKEGKGNFSVCIKKLLELNDVFFERKTTTSQYSQSISIYQTMFDDIDEGLEYFRTKIYFSCNPDYPERTPILTSIKNISDDVLPDLKIHHPQKEEN